MRWTIINLIYLIYLKNHLDLFDIGNYMKGITKKKFLYWWTLDSKIVNWKQKAYESQQVIKASHLEHFVSSKLKVWCLFRYRPSIIYVTFLIIFFRNKQRKYTIIVVSIANYGVTPPPPPSLQKKNPGMLLVAYSP